MSETTADIEQIISDYVDVWNGDFSKINVVSESISLDHPNAPEGGIHGRDAFEDDVRGLHEGFPDHHLTVDAMVTDGEIVMTEWTTTGTHEGEYKGVPPTGQKLDLTGMGKTRVKDGQIQHDRLYYDRQEMFEQLGLME